MAARITPLRLEAFEQLPKHARRCVYWEVDPLTVGAEGHLSDPEFEKEAEQLYREILPVIVFVMQSIEHFLCYGKRIIAARLNLEVHDRRPAMVPTEFGLKRTNTYADMLGPWTE